jgi:hypothetical protein
MFTKCLLLFVQEECSNAVNKNVNYELQLHEKVKNLPLIVVLVLIFLTLSPFYSIYICPLSSETYQAKGAEYRPSIHR